MWKHRDGRKRRRELTLDLIELLCDCIAQGANEHTACEIMRIPRPTWYSWRTRGKHEPDTIYEAFLMCTTQAMAVREEMYREKLIEKIEEKPDWRGYAHVLKQTSKERWGDDPMNKSVPPVAGAAFDVAALEENLSEDEIRSLMGLLRKASAEGSSDSASATQVHGFRNDHVPGVPCQLAPPPDSEKT